MRPARTARGVGMLDALIAVALLAVCSLGLVRFQARMIGQTGEANTRLVATQFADELMSTVLVDNARAGCYTLPTPGSCDSTVASARAADWRTRALAAVPGATAASSGLDASGQRFGVTLQWVGKNTGDAHRLDLATDVR